MADALERFAAKYVVSPSGCWNWTASVNEGGYGQFFVGGKRWRSHRFAWTAFRGEIPAGLELDHLCRNRRCCNPEHLEPVTRRENQRRGNGPTARNIDATHCVNGHAFDAKNTHFRKSGKRTCLRCNADRARARYWRNKQETA